MPLSTEDRLEIMDLAARYNHAIDFGDAGAWAATFTADGSFEMPGRALSGAAELEAFAKQFAETQSGTRHWTNNLLIEGDGDRATLRCYLCLQKNGSGEPVTTGFYTDELRKVDGHWRFAARKVSTP